MDRFREWVTLVLAVFMPPVVLYWCVIHLGAAWLRKLGVVRAMLLVWGGVLAAMWALFEQREWILSRDYGMSWGLAGIGLVFLGVAGWMRRKLGRHFGVRLLIGVPELSEDNRTQRLVTDGLHGRIRHPRYVQLVIAMLGWALIANHAAGYLAWVLWVAGVWVIVVLEERELRGRFGAEYEAYCRRVPRFIPRRAVGEMSV